MENYIIVEGAREHNLKNISVKIPRNKLVVITGPSGSGKSSLAFDTIYAEGQRRYVESLSAYARQFLSLMEKPDVDRIDGLSPAIAIQQRKLSHNPRSTVATTTEIYDYIRLLFARVGTPHCWICGRPIERWTVQGIVDEIMKMPAGHRIMLLAPIIRGRKGEYKSLFAKLQKDGFLRVRVDGSIKTMDEPIHLDKYKKHNIDLVVDRLTVDKKYLGRLAESLETALSYGDGLVTILDYETGDEKSYSEKMACPICGTSLQELSPRMFSFNSPYGACPTCSGLGFQLRVDPDLVVANPKLSLLEGAIAPWREPVGTWYFAQLKALAKKWGIPLHKPWNKLSEEHRNIILYGTNEEIEVEGVGNILETPELSDPALLRALLRFMESPRTIGESLRHLHSASRNEFGVWIGSEHDMEGPVLVHSCFSRGYFFSPGIQNPVVHGQIAFDFVETVVGVQASSAHHSGQVDGFTGPVWISVRSDEGLYSVSRNLVASITRCPPVLSRAIQEQK